MDSRPSPNWQGIYEKDIQKQLQKQAQRSATSWRVLALAWGSLGVIYGDIGTSPLYVYASIFDGVDAPSKGSILGAVSLIFWTLTSIVLIKYVGVVLLADDEGEGGTFAIYMLLCRRIGIQPHSRLLQGERAKLQRMGSASRIALAKTSSSSRLARSSFMSNKDGAGTRAGGARWWQWGAVDASAVRQLIRCRSGVQMALWACAVVSTGMVLGDGVLTPAISVMSAVSGLEEAAAAVTNEVVVGVSVAILVLLFAVQGLGTHRIAFSSAPIVALWLLSNAGVGVYNLASAGGEAWKGLNPAHIVTFFQQNGAAGWRMLGAVMLCVTGAEALYADLGHFNRRAIMLAFGLFVYPCLVVTYVGQAAYLLRHPEDVSATFWKCVPRPYFYPMLVLAFLASIVASQALITGAFSIVANAIKVGAFPRLHIRRTSETVHGQLYVAEVNWVLMVLCVAVVAGFQSTVALGQAYGLTVMTVMVFTTLYTIVAMVAVWGTSMLLVVPFFVFFLGVEGAFLSANLAKIPEGGWFALVIAAAVSYLMLSWWHGSSVRQGKLAAGAAGSINSLFAVLYDRRGRPSHMGTPVPQLPAAATASTTNTTTGTATPVMHSSATSEGGGAHGEVPAAIGTPVAHVPVLRPAAVDLTRGGAAPLGGEIHTPSTSSARSSTPHPPPEPSRRCPPGPASAVPPPALHVSSAPIALQPSSRAQALSPQAAYSAAAPAAAAAVSALSPRTSLPGGAGGSGPLMLLTAAAKQLSSYRPLQLGLRLADSALQPLDRQPGIGVYYSEEPSGLPPVLLHCLRNIRVMHDVSLFLTNRFVSIPHIPPEKRLLVRPLPGGIPNFYQVLSYYGYMDKVDQGPVFVSAVVAALVAQSRGGGVGAAALPGEPGQGQREGLSADASGGASGDEAEDEEGGEVAVAVKPLEAGGGEGMELRRPDPRALYALPAAAFGTPTANAALAGAGVDEDALAHLLEALRQGVVYYVGIMRVRPDPSVHWAKQLLTGLPLYRSMVTLAHSVVEDWKLPADSTVEMGISLPV